MSTASDVKLAGDKSRGSCPTGQVPAGCYGVLGDRDPVGEPALWMTERRKLPKSTTWKGNCVPLVNGGPSFEGHFVSSVLEMKRIERNRRKAKAAKKARKRNRRR